MRNEIRIAGYGGQGVITIGVFLAKAAGQFGNMYVAQSQSYGPEARGGACKTDVVLSDAPIDYVKPLHLGYLLSMHQPAFNKYSATLPDDTFILVDSTLVHDIPPRFTRTYKIDATAIAESLGLKVAANIVMLGALAKLTGWVSRDECERVLEENLPARFLEKNKEAFDRGYDAFDRAL